MTQTSQILTAAEAIQRSTDRDQILDLFARCIGRLGLQHYIYALEDRAAGRTARMSSLDLPPVAGERGDPFFDYCCNDFRMTPTGAAFLSDHPYLPDAAREFIEGMARHGMSAGVALATRLRGSPGGLRGGFNLCGPMTRAEVEARVFPHVDTLRHLCMVADMALAPHSILAAPTMRSDALTPREAEVLHLMRLGLTRQDCAGRLGVSHATVSSHLKSAYSKLGARNLVEALAILADPMMAEGAVPFGG